MSLKFLSNQTTDNKIGIGANVVPTYALDVVSSVVNNSARFRNSAGGDTLVRIIAGDYNTEIDARLFIGESDVYGMTFEYDGSANIGYIGMNDNVDPTGAFSKRIQMSRGGTEVAFMAGKVGIGTTNPDASLHVTTDGAAGTFRLSPQDGTYEDYRLDIRAQASDAGALTMKFKDNTFLKTYGYYNLTGISHGVAGYEDLLHLKNSGNVGIGTVSPDAKLEINDTNKAINTKGNLFVSTTDTLAVNKGGQISLGGVWSGTSQIQFAGIAGRKENATSGNAGGYLQFSTTVSSGGNLTEKMRIASDGKTTITADNGTIMHLKSLGSNANSKELLFQSGGDRVIIDAKEGASPFGVTDLSFELGSIEKMRLIETGQLKLNAYNSTNLTGTPTYLLGTDASGNVVKTNTIPGSGTGPYLPLTGGTLSGPGNLTISGTTNLSSTLTVGADTDGHDVKFFGNATGEYMLWDESDSKLRIYHTAGNPAVDVFTVSAAQPTYPQMRVGRNAAEFWGVYTDDRNAHLVHRQDETTGTMTTRFDQWDSNTSDALGHWAWRSGNGSGGAMSTAFLLTQAGDATFTGIITGQDDGSVQTILRRTSSGTDGNTSIKFEQPLGDGYLGVNANGSLAFGIAANLATNKFKVTRTGDATFGGTVTAASYFLGSGSEISLATTGAGSVFLRPNGQSTSGQMQLASTGNATFAGNITGPTATINGTISTLNTADYGTIQFGSNGNRYIRGNSAELQIGSTLNNIHFQSTGANRIDSGAADGTAAFRINARTSHTSGNLFEVTNANSIKLAIDYDGDTTFTTQAFATVATSTGDASSTLTTKGYVDGLITGATIYRGTWNPDKTQNSGYGVPNLSTVTQTSGYYYICSAVGIAEPNGAGCEPNSWAVGDWVIWNDDVPDCAGTGTGAWQKIDNSSVLSGVGTGTKIARWAGPISVTDSDTLENSSITDNTTYINVTGGVQANYFQTAAANTDYSLISRDSAGNASLYVQAATNGANQPIARFSYGAANAGGGDTVLELDKDNSYFLNTKVGIGTASPGTINGVAFTGVGLHVAATGIGRTITSGATWAEYILNDEGASVDERAKFMEANQGVLSFGSYDDDGTQRTAVEIKNNGQLKTLYNLVVGDGTKTGGDNMYIQMGQGLDVYVNREFDFDPTSSNTEAILLLCAYAPYNNVNGSVQMDRTSGLRHSCRADIVISAGTGTNPIGVMKAMGLAGAGEPSYRLVKFNTVGDATVYIGLEITNPDGYYENTGAYFNGRVTSTGSSLVAVKIGTATGQAENITVFEENGIHDFHGDVEIEGNLAITGTVTAPTFLGDLNGTINTATTGTTQTAGNNSTLIATTAYADAAAGAVPIGNYLPLSAGSSYPLTGPLYITSDGGAANGAEIYLKHANNNTTDTIGTLFFGNNADATLSSIVVETNGANNTSNLKLNTSNAGTMSTALTLQGDNDAIFTGNVGIGNTGPNYKLSVSGGINAGGVVTYSKVAGSLDTTGYAIAGLGTVFNGASAFFTFTASGGTGQYQRIVYSCAGVGTNWVVYKVIDEGTNVLDIEASATSAATIVFTFKTRSGTQAYSPRVVIEATGHSIISTYA